MNVTGPMRLAGSRWARIWHVGSIALVTWCAACGGLSQSSNVVIPPDYDKENGRLERLRHDANGNGVAEAISASAR